MSTKKTIAQPPEKFTGIILEDASTGAAGPKAVKSALQHIKSEVGMVKGVKVLNRLNQFDGFDCPGCAWPDPNEKRAFLAEYCENGAKAVAEEATKKKAGPDFFAQHSVAELGQWSDFELGKSGRITHPMIKRAEDSHYRPIEWDEAFDLMGKQLNALESPDQAIFYTSGRTSNEAAFLYQLFVRQFGTNNLPDCSNMCHESSGTALSETLGIGKGSVTLDDFDQAEVIVVMGQNPGTNHPRMLSALRDARQQGAEIITVNPLPEAGMMNFRDPQTPKDWIGGGTDLTTEFVQVKINGDLAFLKAVTYLLLQEEKKNPGTVFDHSFIETKTQGYESFIKELETINFSSLCEDAGISEEQVKRCANILMHRKKIIICWAMGLTQHKNAVGNIQEVVNLLLLKGSIGKPGAGTCPVRGHSNVQGDRTMGIWEKPKPAFLDKLDETFGFKSPREHGLDVVESIEHMHRGKAKVFFAMGGNFLSATPDTELTAEALKQCELTVHVSTKPNRSHIIHGKTALILPCIGRSETDIQSSGAQFITVENSMSVVSKSRGDIAPCSNHLLSEVAIISRLAQSTLGSRSQVDWAGMAANYDNIRNSIEKVIPGFENFNQRIRQKGGFRLPNNAHAGDFSPTSTGKANFTVNKWEGKKLDKGRYLMMTIRTHDQYNTTIYGLDDRYRGIKNERRVVLMNAEDMKEEGLKLLDLIHLKSHFQGEIRRAEQFLAIPYDIPRGNVATYFPEANVLVPIGLKADKSNTPASKSVEVSLEKA
ncbi:FdhF/YdeP family oxidoreductase [bacterium SCSIO 12741]|nr:FdhF/YdeP family oxidoreductase [bacterium SCSIO 12741]